MTVLKASNVRKAYGDLEAVRGVTFEVARGTIFGILGPNGAGKTSLMRMMVGLAPITSGSIEILGRDISREARWIKAAMGVVPQEPNLDSDMTATDILISHARFYGLSEQRVREVARIQLTAVQLQGKANVRVSELSGGMKRRLLIARALVNDPEVLILDEPTVGLDPQSRALLWDRIREFRDIGRTVLITSHYMDEVERLADQLILLHQGEIIAKGTPRDLVSSHVGDEVIEVDVGPESVRNKLLEFLGTAIETIESGGSHILLLASDPHDVLERILNSGIPVRQATLRRGTLEDAFLKLTGRRLVD